MGLLSACNGILDGIYDEPDNENNTGFENEGEIFIDATSYTQWVYIDFSERSTVTLGYDEDAPQNWDIAVHRYDVKTNGAKVVETNYSDFDQAITATIDEADLVSDIWTTNQIVIDMSTMMDGYLGYTESSYNPELSKWLNVDTSTMPPIYTPSGKVYIVYLPDGTRAGVKLLNFMNDMQVKGYMTIQYMYPFNH
ncbi:MAG: HmuY family protein [Muribaculaceae bacterium]|nr:HmuY family protein [Muribaculaceae bacterium]